MPDKQIALSKTILRSLARSQEVFADFVLNQQHSEVQELMAAIDKVVELSKAITPEMIIPLDKIDADELMFHLDGPFADLDDAKMDLRDELHVLTNTPH